VQINDLQFVLIAQDPDDDSWQLDLRASNGRVSVAEEFYAGREHFEPFAASLQRFGTRSTDEAIFQIGKDTPEWAHYIRLRAFIYSGAGAAALEVTAKSGSTAPYNRACEFFIRTEVAAINRLGTELERWVADPWSVFSWQERA
jgi:hypothetical protein